MRESLSNHKTFFGPDNYLDCEIEEAIKAVQELVPGMTHPDAPEHIVTQPHSQTANTEVFRNSKGFTYNEEDVYNRLKESVDQYFETVTQTIQTQIDKTRNEVTENAKLAAWIESEKKEAATSAT